MNAELPSVEALNAQRGGDAAYLSPTIRRQALYFASGERRLFGWHHARSDGMTLDCAAVICNPLGHEYTHSHRSLRHLADHLADSGLPTLRFDYDATGDSPGEDLSPNRLACWLQDIRAAIAVAKQLSGCDKICLLGLRMGAAFAAMVASEAAVDYLVLWNPSISGKQYVREMKALALTAAAEQTSEFGIESAGFTLLDETAEQLKSVDLLKLPFRRECPVLLLQRDDLEADTRLIEHIRRCAAELTPMTFSGYGLMLIEAQYTVVPIAAIASIVDWLRPQAGERKNESMRVDAAIAVDIVEFTHEEVNLRERLGHFGNNGQLFGVWTEAAGGPDHTKPTLVFLNAGSVHHIGPHRNYVNLTRTFAALGFGCFRFDLEGLGDSYTAGHSTENHPYPSWAGADARSALEYLRDARGCSRFVLIGLCSGAYTVFHAGIDLLEFDVVESILINPLTFYWREGMTLATTQSAKHFQTVAYYRQSVRNARSWVKLLKGQVNVLHLVRVGWAQFKVLFKAYADSLIEAVSRKDRSQLARDLKRYFVARRHLSFFISERDPGYDILMAGAKRVATQAIAAHQIDLQFIAAADHTFSRRRWRMELTERLAAHLCARYR